MATKKYTKEQVEKMDAAAVYAAFGTTEDKEMAWLMNLVETEIRQQPEASVKVKRIRPRADLPVVRMAATEVSDLSEKKKDNKK